MNEQELKEIEDRCNAATPGPWDWSNGKLWAGGYVIARHARDLTPRIPKEGAPFNDQMNCNEIFIAAAAKDIPKLIAEVRRLKDLYEAPSTRHCCEDPKCMNNLDRAGKCIICAGDNDRRDSSAVCSACLAACAGGYTILPPLRSKLNYPER